jgi:hypothetical protein
VFRKSWSCAVRRTASLAHEWLLVTLLVFLGAAGEARAAASGDDTPWTVWVDGREQAAAAPLEVADEILVDIMALAPALNLEVHLSRDLVRVLDSGGRTWLGRAGVDTLESGGELLRLRWVRVGRGTWHLPAPVAAELGSRDLRLDRARRRIDLAAPVTHLLEASELGPVQAESAQGEGWESFTLEKSAEELREDRRLDPVAATPASQSLPPELPPQHDRVRLGLGIGHVEGADWAVDATASGAISGLATHLSAFVTLGAAGAQLYSGRLDVADPDRGWAVEAGDLFSEAWGFARGLRFSWRQGRRHPAVAVYVPDDRGRYDESIVAYRDEIQLGESLVMGGELTSDGAWLVRGSFRHRRLSLYGYTRGTPDGAGSGQGTTFAYQLANGIALQGSVSHTGDGAAGIDWGTASLRLPLYRGADATVEVTEVDGPWGRSRAEAATLAVPLGPLRLRTRYQVRQNEIVSSSAPGRSYRNQELQAGLTYVGGRRLRLDLQGATLWPEGGQTVTWGQLVASYALGPTTSFQMLGTLSGRAEVELYRLRLAQELPGRFEVVVEYGDVPPFQSESARRVGWADTHRLGFTVRRTWDLDTPARGAQVHGRVLETSGRRRPDVAVRLGPYRTYSDARGEFTFRNVPAGSYELYVEPAGAPAHLAPVGSPVALELGRSSREVIDLHLAPLSGVRGHVYVDRNRDGRRGAGEGVAGIVLVLGEEATASATDGSFAFHNVPAGSHRLRLAAEHLPADVAVAGPSELDLGLPSGRSLTTLELRLVERHREVVFQEMP